MHGSECHHNAQARAAVSWLAAALAGGLLPSISQPAAGADEFKPAGSPATSPTVVEKKLHVDSLQSPPLRKRGKQNQEQGDKASNPAEGTCHNTQLKEAPGKGPEPHSSTLKSSKERPCPLVFNPQSLQTPRASPLQSTNQPTLPLAPNTSNHGTPKQHWDMRLLCLQGPASWRPSRKLRKAQDAVQTG